METYYRKYAQKEEVLDVYEKKNEKNGGKNPEHTNTSNNRTLLDGFTNYSYLTLY